MTDTANNPDPTIEKRASAVVTLDVPIKRGDTTITEVTVKKPIGGAGRGLSLSAITTGEIDTMKVLIPRVTDPIIHAADIENGNLDPADFMAISMEIIAFFLKRADRPR